MGHVSARRRSCLADRRADARAIVLSNSAAIFSWSAFWGNRGQTERFQVFRRWKSVNVPSVPYLLFICPLFIPKNALFSEMSRGISIWFAQRSRLTLSLSNFDLSFSGGLPFGNDTLHLRI